MAASEPVDDGRALALARWALALEPSADDLVLAARALTDTVAVTLAAGDDPFVDRVRALPAVARWTAAGHLLDFDDVHLPSTSHVSVVCVNAALATGAGPAEYLAGAGVMARLGAALGWSHYERGWHTSCTAGAPAAAVVAGLRLGLDADGLATAIALSLPGACGVRRSFGTSAKPLQVGLAADAGVRAAHLAHAGVDADPTALDQWFDVVGGAEPIELSGPAVPGGLAIKLHPCCYAMQRPIAAARQLAGIDLEDVRRILVRVTESSVHPLIHHFPVNGLQGKFSLEYAVVAALVDGFPDRRSFTDAAVERDVVRNLLGRVDTVVEPGGTDVMAGTTRVEITYNSGRRAEAEAELPYGAPSRPPTRTDLDAKVAGCLRDVVDVSEIGDDWAAAAALLRTALPGVGERPDASHGYANLAQQNG